MRKPVGVTLFLSASMWGAVALAEPDKSEAQAQAASPPAGAAERGLVRPVAHGTTNLAAAPGPDRDCDDTTGDEAARIKPADCAHAINTKGTGMAGKAAGAPPACPASEARGAAGGGLVTGTAAGGPVTITPTYREGASSAPATDTGTCPLPEPSNGNIKKSKSNISTN